MTEQSLTGRNIAVRGNKSPDVGIVVSGVEVVPAGFDVEVIAAVAERVDVCDVIRVVGHIVSAAVRYAYMLSPSSYAYCATSVPEALRIAVISP